MTMLDVDTEQFEQARELIIELGHIIVEAFKPIIEKMQQIYGTLEPYQKFEQARELIIKLGHILVEVLKPIVKKFQDFFDTLEPYQKFELAHPRKKPRGSLRRIKRMRREQRNE